MSETTAVPDKARPRYRVHVCPTEVRAEQWLNEMAEEGYRFHSLTAVSGTQHFSKEIESVVWMIVERVD